MRKLNLLLALCLLGATVALTACGGKPPADVQKVEKMPAFEEPATPEAPKAAPVAEGSGTMTPPAEEAMPAETETAPAVAEGSGTMTPPPPAGDEVPAEAAPAEAPPETAPAVETPAESTGTVTYAITPNDDSFVGWTGYGGIFGHMDGGFANFEGTITMPGGGDFTQAKIDATVMMDSIFSTSNGLTEKLKDEHFFDVAKFPTATFTSSSVEKTDEGYNVLGNMTIRDTKFGVSLPVKMEMDGENIRATSELTFNRNDWGITYQGTGDNFIKDDVLLNIEILAERQ